MYSGLNPDFILRLNHLVRPFQIVLNKKSRFPRDSFLCECAGGHVFTLVTRTGSRLGNHRVFSAWGRGRLHENATALFDWKIVSLMGKLPRSTFPDTFYSTRPISMYRSSLSLKGKKVWRLKRTHTFSNGFYSEYKPVDKVVYYRTPQ